MLQFSEYFSEHKGTDLMIRQAVNDRLISLLDTVLSWHSVDDPEEITPDNLRLGIGLQRYFPYGMHGEEPVYIFSGLYRLLKSPESLSPDIAMEYLLYKIIEERIRLSQIYGLGTTFPLPNRKEIEESMRINEKGLQEHEIRHALDRLEDLENFEEFCFWDIDFLILDEVPYYGIGRPCKRFYLGDE